MPETISLAIADGTSMSAYVARPDAAPSRGLLVFQEAFGVNGHIRDLCHRFAAQGFLALAPELYHRSAGNGYEAAYTDFPAVMPHLQALTREGLDADIHAAHAWLTQQGVASIAATGFCMGGRVAVQAASAVPLAAAASFYGANLPSLNDRVPALSAPLLIVWGDRDNHIPREQRNAFADACRQHQKPFVECTFSDAGHAFFCDARPAYHAPSAQLAWPLLLAFLSA